MKVLNELLGFPNLKLYQESTMFNFSLDSLLLASFVTIKEPMQILVDFGTNNAVLPLMLSTKFKHRIIGLEIQPSAAKLAKENVALNHLEHRIKIQTGDLREITESWQQKNFKVDVVICNPPFYPYTPTTRMRQNEAEIIARHEKYLTLEQMIAAAGRILRQNGYFAFVHRPDRLVEIITYLKKYNFAAKRLRLVYPRRGKSANMVLIESRYQGRPGLTILAPLYCHTAKNNYTKIIQTWASGEL